ncbi:HAMP domain-containing sensor histidine kinase [Oribacterium sp. WCC10]|uniref:HAMP domain-containing sensor histidine kinase n=1 Tax=Oribacterium sp. WCC10 TaxID=1855343 RepID=UPI0008E876D0|nr:sensor histidine kinase [Oribacterium sp. WCC10]SFG18570.1 Signal transduction histidine kinase [Oribacterium sp. WCC10]
MKAFTFKNTTGSLYFLIMRGFLGFIIGTVILIAVLYSGNYVMTKSLENKYFSDNNNDYFAYDEQVASENGKENTLIQEYEYTYNENEKELEMNLKYLVILDDEGNVIYRNRPMNLNILKQHIEESQDSADYLSKLKIYNKEKAGIDASTAALLVAGEFALMLFFVFKMNKSVLRPLNLLKSALERFDRNEVELEPIEYTGPNELQEICESYNDMAHELKKSNEERKRLEEGRERMLAGISHDIKTPVTVIQGYANAILDGTIPPQNEMTYIETIYKKSLVLSELINTFHEYSRLEHPDFVLRKKRGDIGEYLREYIANRYDELAIAGFDLEVSIPDDAIYAEFDHTELKRVFENLINNTLRHNPKGTTIYVSLEREQGLLVGASEVKPMIRILFGDDGIGISEDIRKTIFDPFVTGDESRKSGKGSGLGLAISKKIVEAHGGYIHLRSKENTDHSTEYEILLPGK